MKRFQAVCSALFDGLCYVTAAMLLCLIGKAFATFLARALTHH